MKTIGYLRVSTSNQDIEKNKAEILLFANEKKIEPVSWVWETQSGRINWKERKIADVINQLQPEDNIIVSELSRLGRPKGTGKSKLDAYRPEISALLANGSTQRFIAQRYQTSETNLSRWLKRNGLSKPR